MSTLKSRRSSPADGFTIVEFLVALVLAAVVLAGVYQLMINHIRLYSIQREAMDTRETLRSAGALLAWDLSAASSADGDLPVIASNSVTLRSVRAAGVICSRVKVGPNYRNGIQMAAGVFGSTANDSALVYSTSFRKWIAIGIAQVWVAPQAWGSSGGGTPFCFWGDSTVAVPRPQATLRLSGDSAVINNLQVGSGVRNFRVTEYGLFENDGRWWLGKRVGAAPNYETLTGPMRSPADSGLVFSYYDANGAVTTDPTKVARVEFKLRAESFGKPAGIYKSLSDSLTTQVYLRNN